MRKLYKVTVEHDLYVVAESEQEAETEARYAICEESLDCASWMARELDVDDVERLDTSVLSSLPWGDMPKSMRGMRVKEWLTGVPGDGSSRQTSEEKT